MVRSDIPKQLQDRRKASSARLFPGVARPFSDFEFRSGTQLHELDTFRCPPAN